MNLNPRKLWSRLPAKVRTEVASAALVFAVFALWLWVLEQGDWRIHENRLPASERTEEAGGTLAPGQKFN